MVALAAVEERSLHESVGVTIPDVHLTHAALETFRVELVLSCNHDWAGNDVRAAITGVLELGPVVPPAVETSVVLDVPVVQASVAAGTSKTLEVPVTVEGLHDSPRSNIFSTTFTDCLRFRYHLFGYPECFIR